MFAAQNCWPQPDGVARISANLAAPAPISTRLRQESQIPPSLLAVASVFSSLRTLLPAQKLQLPYFHSLPRSLKNRQNITPAFPITPALFVRSCARAHHSTLLFSCACALFHKTTGDRGTPAKENFSAGCHLHPAIRHEFDVGPIMDSSRLW